MAEYIEREAAYDTLTGYYHHSTDTQHGALREALSRVPAADVAPVVRCADCKHNNACLTQAFVEDESRVPFERNTFFCADGAKMDMEGE